ncbi:Na+/H+ antiporter, partial [Erwinia amylovora]|nr:Na+/H+ antiporter [Erwinia amylovora]
GEITLAGVLSNPLLLNNGSDLPERNDLVFMETGVIMFSLMIGVMLLPVLISCVLVIDNSLHLLDVHMLREFFDWCYIVILLNMDEVLL